MGAGPAKVPEWEGSESFDYPTRPRLVVWTGNCRDRVHERPRSGAEERAEPSSSRPAAVSTAASGARCSDRNLGLEEFAVLLQGGISRRDHAGGWAARLRLNRQQVDDVVTRDDRRRRRGRQASATRAEVAIPSLGRAVALVTYHVRSRAGRGEW